MTPADPSLLAQLRGFSDWMRRSESDHRVRFANDDYVGDYGYANALKDAREMLTAILEAQPPETAPTPPAISNGALMTGPNGGKLFWNAALGRVEELPTSRTHPDLIPQAPQPAYGSGSQPSVPNGETSGHLAPANTPTGLAPLLGMSKEDVVIVAMQANRADIPEATRIALKVCIDEICAQRQASASVRREAIDEAIIAVRGWSNFEGWASVKHVVDSLKALREPRVSPRPPSGGGQ